MLDTTIATEFAKTKRQAVGVTVEPIAVAPRVACQMLGSGLTKIYKLIKDGVSPTWTEAAAAFW